MRYHSPAVHLRWQRMIWARYSRRVFHGTDLGHVSTVEGQHDPAQAEEGTVDMGYTKPTKTSKGAKGGSKKAC